MKRVLSFVGLAFVVVPVIGAAVIQVRYGSLASPGAGPTQMMHERDLGNVYMIVYKVPVVYHWEAIVPFLVPIMVGVICLGLSLRYGTKTA